MDIEIDSLYGIWLIPPVYPQKMVKFTLNYFFGLRVFLELTTKQSDIFLRKCTLYQINKIQTNKLWVWAVIKISSSKIWFIIIQGFHLEAGR